jgi:hypothetical protein
MPAQFYTADFWKAQWDAFWAAPWVVGPLLLLVAGGVWWLKGRIDDGELKAARADRDTYKSRRDREISGLKAERDAYKTRLALVEDKTASAAREVAALPGELEEIKSLIKAGGQSPTLILRIEHAEKSATTISSTNNEIREIVSKPISIIPKSTG